MFGGNLYNNHLSTAAIWTLGTIDGIIAVAGVFIGLRLWGARTDRPALEVEFLRRAWYIDELYDTVLGRPLKRLATFSSDVIEPKVIDGTVNGVGTAVDRFASLIRRTQTGYVRNYVLGIALGLALMLAFMLTRLWWG